MLATATGVYLYAYYSIVYIKTTGRASDDVHNVEQTLSIAYSLVYTNTPEISKF